MSGKEHRSNKGGGRHWYWKFTEKWKADKDTLRQMMNEIRAYKDLVFIKFWRLIAFFLQNNKEAIKAISMYTVHCVCHKNKSIIERCALRGSYCDMDHYCN